MIGMIWDPETAAQAHRAGQGATLDVSVGGRFPEVGGPPVRARAHIEALSSGTFTFTGPFYGGSTAHLGPMAALKIGGVRVVVGSRRCQNADQEIFRAVGIEPGRQKIVVVKSAVHFLADYEPIAERVIFAAAPGANPCALSEIPYTRLRPDVRLGPGGPAYKAPAREARR